MKTVKTALICIGIAGFIFLTGYSIWYSVVHHIDQGWITYTEFVPEHTETETYTDYDGDLRTRIVTVPDEWFVTFQGRCKRECKHTAMRQISQQTFQKSKIGEWISFRRN